ncbi:hypothetical protein BHU72_01915 [Desulfuribacillus stibiiarsenatis]|uniref:Uncharacterized protein n=1 Tax=Desulfuribacillus stibiiarsenatis TaxID=1390249 RepID=A0A1E5L6F4_9FIRM|nr:hypothetical protein [Desulfuribacillus stibiiarsenatis]OEH85579.1 hypothetical protein BHU72_01915 [Desulfuribacillus stibiiarsenatis]
MQQILDSHVYDSLEKQLIDRKKILRENKITVFNVKVNNKGIRYATKYKGYFHDNYIDSFMIKNYINQYIENKPFDN